MRHWKFGQGPHQRESNPCQKLLLSKIAIVLPATRIQDGNMISKLKGTSLSNTLSKIMSSNTNYIHQSTNVDINKSPPLLRATTRNCWEAEISFFVSKKLSRKSSGLSQHQSRIDKMFIHNRPQWIRSLFPMVLHFTVWKIFLSPPSVATTHFPLFFFCMPYWHS